MEKGGTKGSMKFPMPAIWEYLLQYNYLSKNTDALKAVETTLSKWLMAESMTRLAVDFPGMPLIQIGMHPILKRCFMIMHSS